MHDLKLWNYLSHYLAYSVSTISNYRITNYLKKSICKSRMGAAMFTMVTLIVIAFVRFSHARSHLHRAGRCHPKRIWRFWLQQLSWEAADSESTRVRARSHCLSIYGWHSMINVACQKTQTGASPTWNYCFPCFIIGHSSCFVTRASLHNMPVDSSKGPSSFYSQHAILIRSTFLATDTCKSKFGTCKALLMLRAKVKAWCNNIHRYELINLKFPISIDPTASRNSVASVAIGLTVLFHCVITMVPTGEHSTNPGHVTAVVLNSCDDLFTQDMFSSLQAYQVLMLQMYFIITCRRVMSTLELCQHL